MKLQAIYNCYWTCIDQDTYGHYSDAGLEAHLIGLGRTEQEAIRSWHKEYQDYQDSLKMALPDDILTQSASMPIKHDALDDKVRDDLRADDREP